MPASLSTWTLIEREAKRTRLESARLAGQAVTAYLEARDAPDPDRVVVAWRLKLATDAVEEHVKAHGLLVPAGGHLWRVDATGELIKCGRQNVRATRV